MRLKLNGHPFIITDWELRHQHWAEMSDQIKLKFGLGPFDTDEKVQEVLLFAFDNLVSSFDKHLEKQKNYQFFKYVFWLHEESILIWRDQLKGLDLEEHTYEFSIYRRVLKLILEKGCDIDLNWGKAIQTNEELELFDLNLQHLLYLGQWAYGIADMFAFQKMIPDCHNISFNDEGYLKIKWKYHFGDVYEALFPQLAPDYENGAFDELAILDLKEQFRKCFKVDFDNTFSLIFQIKKHHAPGNPSLQPIEPYILPINLSQSTGISQVEAERIFNGLTITRNNKLSTREAILKPYSISRFMFRPILVYNISGKNRAIVGEEKFAESLVTLSTNAMHWNNLPAEWLENKCLRNYVHELSRTHDRLLEDAIETLLKKYSLTYSRNLTTLKTKTKNNHRITISGIGEIDFLILDPKLKRIIVAETKYNRTRYEGIGFRLDYTNFTNTYEEQLSRKHKWISENKDMVSTHFAKLYNQPSFDLSDYSCIAVFFVNTPTFYMFNGKYHAITLNRLDVFLKGESINPTIRITYDSSPEKVLLVSHPYFKPDSAIAESIH